jgi:potassium-transporting ATPase KdpC subunit
MIKKNLLISAMYTAATTALLGFAYPLLITVLAQVRTSDPANGSLITRDGKVVGSKLIAQPFTSPAYFHPRPSAAGANGYDAANSGATNYGPTNQKLTDRVKSDTAAIQAEDSAAKKVPIDMVTTSASGLDPDITPANAEFQIPRVAVARSISQQELLAVVQRHIQPRQLGFLGEPRINVLELNLDLDKRYPLAERPGPQ